MSNPLYRKIDLSTVYCRAIPMVQPIAANISEPKRTNNWRNVILNGFEVAWD